MSLLNPTSSRSGSRSASLVERSANLIARSSTRRGFLARVAVLGSALSVAPGKFLLEPGTAYAAVCGSGSACASGWTAFCCTTNGFNACPTGSLVGGWWKADNNGFCGGGARYYIDCQAKCTKCTNGCSDHFCDSGCLSCSAHCAKTCCVSALKKPPAPTRTSCRPSTRPGPGRSSGRTPCSAPSRWCCMKLARIKRDKSPGRTPRPTLAWTITRTT